ncbi:MAG: squalene/phytoene synthase family protein [Candidatus Micrarchaeaceae archaeon]
MSPSPTPTSSDPFAIAYRPGTSYGLVLLFTPAKDRDVLAFLYAFKLTLDMLLEAGHEPEVMRLKARWWQEEITANISGRPRHPLLVHARRRACFTRVDPAELVPLVQAYAALVAAPTTTAEAILARARLTGGELGARTASALGLSEPEGLEGARAVGTAHEAVALLLHDRATRESLASQTDERAKLARDAANELSRARAHVGPLWRHPALRPSRILAALTRARLAERGRNPWRNLFTAWWQARQEDP